MPDEPPWTRDFMKKKSVAKNRKRQPRLAPAGLLARWRECEKKLIEWRSKTFPCGTIVSVDCPQYRGKGRVVPSSQCPSDKVAVVLCNDNIWWYPLESVKRANADLSGAK